MGIWQTLPGGKKIRFRFSEPGQPIPWLAGLFKQTEKGNRFTILTTKANKSMSVDEVTDWLQGEHLKDYLMRVPFPLDAENVQHRFEKMD